MHVHGSYIVPATVQASAYPQTQALAQKRAEETRRKLASSALALTEPGDGARSHGQAQQQKRRNPSGNQEDGQFAHLFSVLG
jgi:hypothetical protein